MTPERKSAHRSTSGLNWLAAVPAVFVFLWSTGFIGAKLGLPYAEPATFLTIRHSIVAFVLLAVALATRAPWPKRAADWGHFAVMGLMFHGVYLGGVFFSIHLGVEAGASALITGIQPLLVATLAGPLLGERVSGRQWLGFLLGFIGVFLVIQDKLALGIGTPFAMGLSGFALIGMTIGTLYQKRFGQNMDLRSGSAIQFAAAAIAMGAIALTLESGEVQWTGEFIFAMFWLCVVMSFGAVSLLYLMIRRGAASRVSSLLYMVPASTALIAYFLFDETLSVVAMTGVAVAMAGVAMVNVRPAGNG